MAKISNTISYPGQSPIEGADYLIGTAANSTPIGLQTKTFTIQGIADFIIDAAFDGVSYRLPIFTAASETFNKKNTNCDIQTSLRRFKPIMNKAKKTNYQ